MERYQCCQLHCGRWLSWMGAQLSHPTTAKNGNHSRSTIFLDSVATKTIVRQLATLATAELEIDLRRRPIDGSSKPQDRHSVFEFEGDLMPAPHYMLSTRPGCSAKSQLTHDRASVLAE